MAATGKTPSAQPPGPPKSRSTSRPAPPLPGAGPLSYAKVAINRPLDQLYTYYVPESMSPTIRIGSVVLVPLRNDQAEGVVIDLLDKPDGKFAVKPVIRQLTPDFALTGEIIDLCGWIAHYYFCSLGETLAMASMIGLNEVGAKTQNLLQLAHPEHWLTVNREAGPEGVKTTGGHRTVIAAMLGEGNPALSSRDLCQLAGVGDGVLKTMIKHGWLLGVREEVERDDLGDGPEEPHQPEPVFELTARQREVMETLGATLDAGQYQTFLLHGVTGSGKTEIYLRLIQQALRAGRTGIVLVPEIALTPQTVANFRRRLGKVVGVYHSRMSLGQKYDLWRKVRDGQVRVVIGARSALFAPLPFLGVVIVDEEHESSYKQGETPRYHARDVAVMRASRNGAVAVLGSATPSIESLHNAREGKYRLLRLPERVGPHANPVMKIVDLKQQLLRGASADHAESFLSETLLEALAKRLADGQMSVLLLNRRGFANHVLCLACEKPLTCPNCDVTMTYHKTIDKLICHWCGHKMLLPVNCPSCGRAEMKTLGFGTQRVEETLAAKLPGARLLRVDMDSMRKRGAYEEAWRKINHREVDIILGTQMIAKGLHIESVTLVGVISADFALFLPDFRAAERTYALLTQVAGRAGRGQDPGEVILQTFIPHHYAIDSAARLAETEFYEREFHIRNMLRFPPFARLAALLMTGPDSDLTRDQASRLGNILKGLAYRPHYKAVKVLGPTPAPIARIENQYRWRVLLRSGDVKLMHTLLRQGLAEFHRVHKRGQVNLTIDIDPVDLM